MIKHYLKVAFRNLMKYKTQSLVSIIGLAVGFTCFALSVLWIRYEMTYDTFHKGAERIYEKLVPWIHKRPVPMPPILVSSNGTYIQFNSLPFGSLSSGKNAGNRSKGYYFYTSECENPHGK